jgi:heme A synthase
LFSFKISLTKPVLYAIRLVCGIILLQFLSGILTLLWNVPVAMASIHQSLAFVLFATTLFINFMIKKNNG